MATAARIAQSIAQGARAGQVSVGVAGPVSRMSVASRPQVNAAGEVFWSMGSPLCAGQNPHPYPPKE